MNILAKISDFLIRPNTSNKFRTKKNLKISPLISERITAVIFFIYAISKLRKLTKIFFPTVMFIMIKITNFLFLIKTHVLI